MANTLKIKRGLAAGIPQGQLAEPLFTTDTYDLYIGKGSGGNQRFQKYIASGTSSQFLKGDGSLDSTTYEPSITAGTTLQYWRGDKSWQTLDTSVVPENGPVYFTEPRVRATVLTGLNLTGGGTIAATDSVLQAFGKIQNQISAIGTGVAYQGTWNANTNTPTITSGTGTAGYYYVVNVAGSTTIDGISDWNVGDWIIFNGTVWDQVDNTDAVSSVNGFTGAVNLALDNISDVSAASPTNAQLLRFNGTSSLWENWTPTFEPALTKGNLTEATSSVLTITGGTGAVIGSGTSIEVKQASGSVSGYLSSTDWTTFNNKQNALTNPVTGTGTINQLAYFSATGSTITSSSNFYIDNSTSYLYSPYIFATSEFVISGTSGGNNKIYLSGTDFTIRSTFDALRLQGGINNSNKRQVNIYNGDTIAINVETTGITTFYNIPALATAASTFLVSDSGTLKSRTAAQVLSDIGAQAALTNPVTGTGTSGTLAKFSGTSTINDSVIVQSGTDILIGATADQGKLQIDGTAAGGVMLNCVNTQFGFTIKNTSSSNKKWDLSPYNNNLYISESGVGTRMAFIAGGNVAINDTSAGLRLSIKGTEGVPATTGTSQNGSLRFGGGDFVLDMGNSIGDGTPSQYTAWLQATDKTALGTNYKISLNPNGGNVGINKLNPSVALDVSGAGSFSSSVTAGTTASGANINAYVSSYGNNGLFQSFGTDGNLKLQLGGLGTNEGFIYTGTGNKLSFYSGGSLSLTLASTGTATFSSSVTATSYYGIDNANLIAENLNTNGTVLTLNSKGTVGTVKIQTASTDRLTIASTGNVGIGTSSPSALTEIRVNTNDYGNNLILANTYPTNGVGTSISFGHNTQSADPDIMARISGYVDDRTSANRYGSLRFYTATGGTLSERMRITSGGATQIKGTLATYTPGSTTTLGPTYKLGSRIVGTCNTSTTAYLEVEVGGTIYYLAFANPL